MEKLQIRMNAKDFFTNRVYEPEMLPKVSSSDEVMVTLEFEGKRAEYTWFKRGRLGIQTVKMDFDYASYVFSDDIKTYVINLLDNFRDELNDLYVG